MEILGDIGVMCLMDDSGKMQTGHDQCLLEVLSPISQSGLMLSLSKCEINKTNFWGSWSMKMPDPEKVYDILQMKPPTPNFKDFSGW